MVLVYGGMKVEETHVKIMVLILLVVLMDVRWAHLAHAWMILLAVHVLDSDTIQNRQGIK
jgi:hypothetical protein